MNNVTLIGIDTAKTIFHLHAVDAKGKQVYQKALRRDKLLSFLVQQAPCEIAIEACSGSHHWARTFNALGHQAKIIRAKRVKQFAPTRNKNDFNDARAITKAARDEDTYYVAAKSIEQQEIQAIHTLREAAIRQRTATINRVRALCVEFGFIMPQGRCAFMKALPVLLEETEQGLTLRIRTLVHTQYEEIKRLDKQIQDYDESLEEILKQSTQAQRLDKLPGVGTLISTALVFMIGDPKVYKNGRNCAAALGLTPKEHSSGGKQRLGAISGEGNNYLRKCLVQGAHAVLRQAHRRTDRLSQWAYQLKQKKGTKVAAVALANKLARIAWACLVKEDDYAYPSALQAA